MQAEEVYVKSVQEVLVHLQGPPFVFVQKQGRDGASSRAGPLDQSERMRGDSGREY